MILAAARGEEVKHALGETLSMLQGCGLEVAAEVSGDLVRCISKERPLIILCQHPTKRGAYQHRSKRRFQVLNAKERRRVLKEILQHIGVSPSREHIWVLAYVKEINRPDELWWKALASGILQIANSYPEEVRFRWRGQLDRIRQHADAEAVTI